MATLLVLLGVVAVLWLVYEFVTAPTVPEWRDMEHPSGTRCLKCGTTGLGMLEDCPNGCDEGV